MLAVSPLCHLQSSFFLNLIPCDLFSGLGYIVGAEVTDLVKTAPDDFEAWRWGLRVTPAMGLIAVILILTIIRNPPRGQSEGGQHLHATSFKSDLVYLFTKYVYCFISGFWFDELGYL